MAAPGNPGAMRAQSLLRDITPELLEILQVAPRFGSIELGITLLDDRVTSFDFHVHRKRRVDPRDGGR